MDKAVSENLKVEAFNLAMQFRYDGGDGMFRNGQQALPLKQVLKIAKTIHKYLVAEAA